MVNRAKINKDANKKLREIYFDKGITSCELRMKGCTGSFMLGWHHKHSRVWYYDKPELLGSYWQTVLACTNCHQRVEYNKKLHKEVFTKLRCPRLLEECINCGQC